MSTSATAAKVWAIDVSHSIAEFSVKHLVVSTVKGQFRQWEGTITFDEANPAASSASAVIQTASIDTGVEMRDNHLRSDDFFNAEKYPTLSFNSTRVEVKNASAFRLVGNLTIRDVTKEVAFDVEYDGQITNPYGQRVAAFTAETSINRKEYNLNWNAALETGGAVVSDKVKITLHVEAVLQA